MSVYGRGTKNGQYISNRNSYDSYKGNPFSRNCNPLNHGFDNMIETARNKVIVEDLLKNKLEENEDIKKYLNMNTSILMAIVISFISVFNLFFIITNFNSNSLFFISSFILNSAFVLLFLSKLFADCMMKNSIFYYQQKTNKEFIFVSICLLLLLFNSFFILS